VAKIEIRNLTFTYPGQSSPAVNCFSLSIEAGELVVLCGPSGCGKSTLLYQPKPALAPHGTLSGEILLDGVPVRSLDQRAQRARIGFVQQSPDEQIVTD